MRPAMLVAGSVVCATLGAADLGVLSIVVVPRWLEPGPSVEAKPKPPPLEPVKVAARAEPAQPPGPTQGASPSQVSGASKTGPTSPAPQQEPRPVARPTSEELVLDVTEATGKPESTPRPGGAAQGPEDTRAPESGRSARPERRETASAEEREGAIVVRFDLERADIGQEAKAKLRELVASAGPNDRFRVEGHADASGREDGNRYFSRERARAVARELVRQGVAPSRITSTSFGSTRPLVSGRGAAVFERNRRVEIFLERSGR